MKRTKIPWCRNPDGTQGYSWNPTRGCNGPNGVRCPYCYMTPLDRRFHRSSEPTIHPEKLDEPRRLKNPATIFVDSAGDLFDPAIPDMFIDKVFDTMTDAYWHTFIALTKQAARMQAWAESRQTRLFGHGSWLPCLGERRMRHIWLGITAEHQSALDERYEWLRQTPAALRFISAEPLQGPLQVPSDCGWVIVGNDSSIGAPLPDPRWVESIINQCRAANLPVFVKGAIAAQFPIKEFPAALRPKLEVDYA